MFFCFVNEFERLERFLSLKATNDITALINETIPIFYSQLPPSSPIHQNYCLSKVWFKHLSSSSSFSSSFGRFYQAASSHCHSPRYLQRFHSPNSQCGTRPGGGFKIPRGWSTFRNTEETARAVPGRPWWIQGRDNLQGREARQLGRQKRARLAGGPKVSPSLDR